MPESIRLVGRGEESRAIAAALHGVEQGETAAVFVVGRSGVGKTELMRAAAADLRAAGAVVLEGMCLDIGDVPLHPLRQALRRYVTGPGKAGPGPAGELLALLDDQAVHPIGEAVLIERASAGLRTLLEGQALALMIDDLHWVDRTTERLLRYLLAGLGGIRLLVVGAARDDALNATHPVSALRRLSSVQLIQLEPLNLAATEALATAIVGRPLDYAELASVWSRSGGMPYLVEALARSHRDGVAELPTGVLETVLAPLSELPHESKLVLSAVAAGVEPVPHALLAQVVPLSEEELIRAVRLAVDQRVLEAEDDAYRFHMGVYKELLERDLLAGERLRLHRRYAEAVEAADGRDPRLAYHWRLAGQREKAVRCAIAAAANADRMFQYSEAFRSWELALAVFDEARPGELPDVDRTTVVRAAAEAAHRSGEHQRALEILERLPGPTPAWLHISRARYCAAVGRPAEAEAEYERVLAAPDASARERAMAGAYSADLLVQLGRYAEAGRRAAAALGLAHTVGDASSATLASGALGFSQAYLADPDAGRAAVLAALRTAEESQRPADIARAHIQVAELLTDVLNELAEGIAAARRGAARCAALGLARTAGAKLLAIAANGLFRAGEWREAEACVDEALRHHPSGGEAAELLLARGRIFIGYGDLDAAKVDLDGIETLSDSARHRLPLLILRAGLAMWRGDHADARRAVKRGLDLYRHQTEDIVPQVTLLWHGLRAEAEAHASGLGADPEAVARLRQLAGEVSGGAEESAAPVRDAVVGYLALCDGELSRIGGTSDPAAWEQAEQLCQARGQPYPVAYAQLRRAEALYAQRTRNATADALLRTAFATATRLTARPLAQEIHDLADRARVRLDQPADPPAEPPPDPGAQRDPRHSGTFELLTDREYEVLALVAAGFKNHEIGTKLFISPRTVGVHVSHVLAKLQVKSRVQATSIFQRRTS